MKGILILLLAVLLLSSCGSSNPKPNPKASTWDSAKWNEAKWEK